MPFFLPVTDRTVPPTITGTPHWYAEASTARTQLDITYSVPADANKVVLLWLSDVGELPTAVTFEPAGVNFPMVAINGAFGENDDLRVAGYYLDTPPTGSKTFRIATASAAWSAVRIIAFKDARAGDPEATAVATTSTGASVVVGVDLLLDDAYSITVDMIGGIGLSEGDLDPYDGQTLDQDAVINSAFLAAGSSRTHNNNGASSHGWTATNSTTLLSSFVNVLFSTGQVVIPSTFQEISRWEFDESGTLFSDEHGLSNASITAGTAAGGQDPLYSGGTASLSVNNTNVEAGNVTSYQIRSYTFGGYNQLNAWPASSNHALAGKDTGLPVPGGWQAEIETDGALDVYIRDSTGLAGTGIHVTGATGDGEIPVDTGFLWALAYDDETKTANVYLWLAGGSPAGVPELLASKTDANFSGLENNTAPFSFGSRALSSTNGINGNMARYFFGAGAMSLTEFSNLAAPTSIVAPEQPGEIVMQDISLGVLAASSVTDIDPTDHGTGFVGGSLDLFQRSDPANRVTFLNDPSDADNDPPATIRVTLPAAPSTTTNESAVLAVAENGGTASNDFTVTWIRQGQSGGGGFTPFPFVTNRYPAVNHTGITSRPAFNAANPRAASFIDPMSGLEMFRITGNVGTNVLLRGSVDSGLNFPMQLKPENNPRCPRTWNADGSLLMLPESKTRSGDPADPCRYALFSATGAHMGATQPFQIIRAGGTILSVGNVPTTAWFWDPLNPLRAYFFRSDGCFEWWPAGGSGHTVGEANKLFNVPAGYTDWEAPRGGRAQPSHNGLWYHAAVRQTSTGYWGGIRINLQTGAANNFVPNPAFLAGNPGLANDDDDRGVMSTGALGTHAYFEYQDDHSTDNRFVNMINGQSTTGIINEATGHSDHCHVDGIERVLAERQGKWKLYRLDNGALQIVSTENGDIGALNVAHPSCRNYFDLFETYGGTGSGSSSGLRYGICSTCVPHANSGVYGVRLGANDQNVYRYICHPRSVRDENGSEVHAAPSPTMNYVAVNSNWCSPGVETQKSHVNTYVVVIPNAWRSPNNNGSAV